MTDVAMFLGRVLLAALFLVSGAAKAMNFEGTQIYMDIMGMPGGILPLVLFLEIGGSLCLIAGVFMRTAAVFLAFFCLLTAIVFHSDFSQQLEISNFLKNMAIAGGLIVLSCVGPGKIALSGWGR
ncbi:MAG: DoxX family protein [Hahellaceae bacterium]|nr:DoxX family protein [Hahellaceae bacterium]MCP5211168.1 DoxX family protein [Hahellaceae bacterium]